MTLIKLPHHPVKTASAELDFSSVVSHSAKFTLNINAFNGNKTNFGRK